MKKIIGLIVIIIVSNLLFSTEVDFDLNIKCKNDPNLLLKKAVLTDFSAEFYVSYKNSGKKNQSIGIYPPQSDKSMFLYNEDGSKIYYLKDVEVLPKWWPQKKYILKSNEEVNFVFHFEKPEPTKSLSIVEGKNNFNSPQGWIFLNIPVNTYNFICKKTIELLDKPELKEKENNLLTSFRKYEFINDFISYYANKTDQMKKIFLEKWKNDERAAYFINYLLKKDYDKLILKPDIAKADSIITHYPKTDIAKSLKKFIKPILIKQIHADYINLQQNKNLKNYALFLNKYSGFFKTFPDLTDYKKASKELKEILKAKREELKNKQDPKEYNKFFAKYGKKNFINTLYKDYLELEEKKYKEALIINSPQVFDNFLSNFPNSKYATEIHKKYFEYFKTNKPSLDIITNYAGKYPNSPYINEIIALVPKSVEKLSNKASKNKRNNFATKEEKIKAFKNSIKKGDVLHFTEKIRVNNPSSPSKVEIYDIIYTAKVLMMLKTKIRIKIIDASLPLENPAQYILNSFQDLKDVMIDTIEDKEISKFKEFEEF